MPNICTLKRATMAVYQESNSTDNLHKQKLNVIILIFNTVLWAHHCMHQNSRQCSAVELRRIVFDCQGTPRRFLAKQHQTVTGYVMDVYLQADMVSLIFTSPILGDVGFSLEYPVVA